MAAKRKTGRKRAPARRRVAPEPQDMRMVRLRVGTSLPLHPEDIGIATVPGRVAKALLDSKQAVPVCGTNRDIQIAALCTAAEALAVTLTTPDPAINEAALRYGARCQHPKARPAKGEAVKVTATDTPTGTTETPTGGTAPTGTTETPRDQAGAGSPDGSKTELGGKAGAGG